MKTAFINTLIKLARKDKRIFLLTGDLGFSVLENFRNEFPKRFFNIGVSEQNMIGIAAGLALSGKIVFVYSIIPFATMRCFEQVRNDLCMQNLDVRIVGIGAGLLYGSAGPTHHAIEDIGIMRSLPNMTVISPAIPDEVEGVVVAAARYKGPIYMRLGKNCGSLEGYKKTEFRIGKGVLIEEGKDITIISTGSILHSVKKAAETLKAQGISARLINIHTIKPIDSGIILKAARETKAVFTIEEHSVIGGLGSSVAEILAEANVKTLFKRIGLPDTYVKKSGSGEYLLQLSGLSIDGIVNSILKELKSRK